ncbi:hypothetical protein PFISCL1PPCAC_2403, partial [Pristionchus fissidentatus]
HGVMPFHNGYSMTPMLLFLVLLSPLSIDAAGDPIETIVSNFMLTVRSMGEKWLANVAIPNLEDVNSNPNIAYSVDAKTANALTSFGNFLNTCPVYLPLSDVEGTWYLVLASKRILQTTLSHVDQVIEKLASSVPLSDRKSMESLFRDVLDLQCGQMTILSSGSQPRFEWSYTSRSTPHSIIGSILTQGDRSIVFSFAPTAEIKMAAVWTSADSLVFSQVDTWPPCDNHLVFTRNRGDNLTLLRERLTLQGANLPSNPLIPVLCQTNIKPIISPVPSSSIDSPSYFNRVHPWSSISVSSNQNPSNSLSIPSSSQPNPTFRSPIPANLAFTQTGKGYVQVVEPQF